MRAHHPYHSLRASFRGLEISRNPLLLGIPLLFVWFILIHNQIPSLAIIDHAVSIATPFVYQVTSGRPLIYLSVLWQTTTETSQQQPQESELHNTVIWMSKTYTTHECRKHTQYMWMSETYAKHANVPNIRNTVWMFETYAIHTNVWNIPVHTIHIIIIAPTRYFFKTLLHMEAASMNVWNKPNTYECFKYIEIVVWSFVGYVVCLNIDRTVNLAISIINMNGD